MEIDHDGPLVATHARTTTPGTDRTAEAHLPPAHAAVRPGVPPTAWLEWAAAIGPTTRQLVAVRLERAVIPEPQYPRCRGILHLAAQFSPAVRERAAARALETGVDTVRALTAFGQPDQTSAPRAPARRRTTTGGAHSTSSRRRSPMRRPAVTDRLHQLHLTAMAAAWTHQPQEPDVLA